ncbi:metallophosphoesterase family protein [Deinococcus lacus]|uniref:Phosphoesterase n=1 Tax=Deinococcus lacus TaxID=392561 RepID=A0ABW1YAI7_9DEIO
MRILLLSDTHGLLRPEVLTLAQQADAVLHAGDVGDVAVLTRLEAAAPLTAVRGNVDRQAPLSQLPLTEWAEFGEYNLYLLHDLADLDLDPGVAGVHAVISGHTHRPALEQRGQTLLINPGAVGPRRFRLPISAAWLTLEPGGPLAVQLLTLNSAGSWDTGDSLGLCRFTGP